MYILSQASMARSASWGRSGRTDAAAATYTARSHAGNPSVPSGGRTARTANGPSASLAKAGMDGEHPSMRMTRSTHHLFRSYSWR